MKRILILIAVAAMLAGCQHKEHADLIIHNAKIYSVNNNFSVMQSAAICDGRFVAVSSDAIIKARYYSDNVVDMQGKYVFPAFIDSHSRFLDYAFSLADSVQGQLSESQKVELLKRAEKRCFSMGISTVTDFGTSYNNVKLIDSLQQKGELMLSVYAVLEPSAENISQYISRMPYHTNKLKVISVGVNLDGGLASQEAVLLSPYTDNTNGRLLASADSLERICSMAYNNGFQMCVGCVGDSAARVALKTFADILPRKNSVRWRVENLQMTSKRDLRFISHYNILPMVIPASYADTREKLPSILSKKQIRETFAWKKILGQNQGILCGINAPDEPINPMRTMYSAMRQEKQKLRNKQGQEMTSVQALKAMTIWAAYAQFDEENKGSIEVGKNADFIVTNENLTTMYKPYLPDVKIVSTYLCGQKVYDITQGE